MTFAHYDLIAEWSVRVILGLVVVLRRHSPATSLAWLVVIGFVPFVGAIAYFLVGENRLGLRRARQHALVTRQVARSDGNAGREPVLPGQVRRFDKVVRLATAVGAPPPLCGNELRLLSWTEQVIDSLVEDIDAARSHCHLLYYIFSQDSLAERVCRALIRAAGRGVACRVLVDAVGSRAFLRGALRRSLEGAGVAVVAALPVNPLRALVARIDLRNHRKLAVIDGKVAYCGSHNLSGKLYPRKERYGAWVDASVRITGPAVTELQRVFLQDWAFDATPLEEDPTLLVPHCTTDGEGCSVQVLPTGPNSVGAPLEDVMLQAIREARETITLTTPYFVPDEGMLAALRSASLRGVEVVLIVPKRSDHRVTQAAGQSHYELLLDVGVRIYRYAGGLLHSKTLTIDGLFSIISSANLDVRSFLLNFELALLVYDSAFHDVVAALHEVYLRQSEPLLAEAWSRRGRGQILVENLAKLLTPLL